MKHALAMITLLILGTVAITGCNSPGCIVEGKLVEVATNVTATKLQCRNTKAVQASMQSLVGNLALCKKADSIQGPLADAFCPLLTSAVVEFVASKGIPAEWDCSATDAKAFLKDALSSACKQIPVSN